MPLRNFLLTAAALSLIVCLGWSAQVHAQTTANLTLTDPSSPIGQRGLVYQGTPVFAVGTGSFWLFSDPYYYETDGNTNLSRLRDHLDKYRPTDPTGKAKGVIRVSAFGTPVRYSGVDHAGKRYPCLRTGPGTARDGGLKFDCSQHDPNFFDHVLNTVREADQRGILIGIILWDEIPLESNTYRWNHNPFCPDNNVNNYGLPSCGGNAVPEFYDADGEFGQLRSHQDAIVEKFVDVLRDEPNVFFFISNEYTGGTAWRNRQIATIDGKNTANGSSLLHVTMDWDNGPSSVSNGVSVASNDAGLGQDAYRVDGRPAINERDRQSGTDRITAWMRLMDGAASAGTRDEYDGDSPPSSTFVREQDEDEQLRRFVSSTTAPLDRLVPNDSPFSSGWSGRVALNTEYVAYEDGSSGSITVDLSAETGTWVLLDWDPTDTSSPTERGVRTGGSNATWTVREGECAVRIVRTDSGPVEPPAAPQDLTATAQSMTAIDLAWSASTDPDWGIAYYRVYRDSIQVGQPSNTFFTDSGLTESTTYTYQVSAVNGAGLESGLSAPATATTMGDTTPPSINSVSASVDPTRVVVVFSEPVEETSATTVSNYAIDHDVSVDAAALAPDLVTVELTTSLLSLGTTYTLTVNNVSDLAAEPNAIPPNTTATFEFLNTETVEIRIGASEDDVEEGAGGSVSDSSSDLELVADGSDQQTVGMRFLGVQIPQGAAITQAHVQFTVDETSSGSTSLLIEGENSDNAVPFGTVTSRARTLSSAQWAPSPWSTAGEAGPDQRTPDISPIIQEIVNRPGWTAGNALVLIITGTGARTAESFDGDSAAAPLLHVEFSSTVEPPSDPPSPPATLRVQ